MQPQQPGQQVPPTLPPTGPAAQQSPNQPSGEHPGQYDFIMNPQQASRKAPLAMNNSLPMRILLVVGGLFVLIILAVVVLKALGASGSFDKAAMLSVAQDQTELVSLGTAGSSASVSQTGKNLAVNLELAITTDQASLLSYLKDKGYSPKAKTLTLKHSASTDTQLANATSASTYDSTFAGIAKQDLTQYQHDLTKAYGGLNPQGQAILKRDFSNAQLLLEQLTLSGN